MSTLHEINEKAQAALRAALSPAEFVRYLQQFSNGHGDYTAERQQRPEEDGQAIHDRTVARVAAGVIVRPPNAKVLAVE